jgi:ABC-2 type transport system ATP-binding protein
MIQIKNLQKIKDGVTILDLEGIHVESGEIVAFVGPQGSGLSTLRDLLLGKSKPSGGVILLDGLDPWKDRKPLSGKLGVLFKEDALYTQQTVEKNLLFFARLYNLPQIRVHDVLKHIGLADQASVKVESLPAGLARRLALGRSILNQPNILILEGPLVNCDENSITTIKQLIRRQAENGAAIMILNEDSTNLEDLCSRIMFLKQGRIDEIREGGEVDYADNLPFKIPIKLEGRVALLNPGDILYAEAAQGRTILITKDSQLPSQFTLNELEERLKRSGFFRAHRSYLVNLQHVQDVIPYSRNSFSLRLTDPNHTKIPLSKNAEVELRELLDY